MIKKFKKEPSPKKRDKQKKSIKNQAIKKTVSKGK
jgi:hypothetical protein